MRGLAGVLACALIGRCRGDNYLNHPRGSNNKLNEVNNQAQNQNRLFDSQNNAAAGYQVGDKCEGNCMDGNGNYDPTTKGATEGKMRYYVGSEVYVEWIQQHGCGTAASGQRNLQCQMIVQYMCDGDDATPMRDGTKQPGTGGTTAGGDQNADPTPKDAGDPRRGIHESYDFYNRCARRDRNKGLFIADKQVNDNQGATATRQNPNQNNRHGLECPEERDYYPYWHPTPWRDALIITSDPSKCEYYKAESQNVKEKGYCYDEDNGATGANGKVDGAATTANNPDDCKGSWRTNASWGIDPPVCVAGQWLRDNHNGNSLDGLPYHYQWKIPKDAKGNCILRTRYNVSTGDFAGVDVDPFFVDSTFNERGLPALQKDPLTNDPDKDYVGLGDDNSGPLQLQINTAQFGRVFQDRTHIFQVLPLEGSDAPPEDERVVNFNVRGRRGNIVQVYPSVEYDFVPPELSIYEGDWIHFQWTGSDANDQNNAGNGRAGTDRSNLVQVASRDQTAPLTAEDSTFFVDGYGGGDCPPSGGGDCSVAAKFAFLWQGHQTWGDPCDPDANDDNADDNCKQLNKVPTGGYFNHPPIKVERVGTYHFVSTRNNDFSNRSHKTTITVLRKFIDLFSYIMLGIFGILFLALLLYLIAAAIAWNCPHSLLFGPKYRPRVLYLIFHDEQIREKEQLRRERLGQRARSDDAKQQPLLGGEAGAREGEEDMAPSRCPGVISRCGRRVCWLMMVCPNAIGRCCGSSNLPPVLAYLFITTAIGFIGWWKNKDGGFATNQCPDVQGASDCSGRGGGGVWAWGGPSLWFPFAKGFGYALDFNLAVVVLPALRNLQTGARQLAGLGNVIPFMDDPVQFHRFVGRLIVVLAILHTAAHFLHFRQMHDAVPLGPFKLPGDDPRAGKGYYDLFFDWRIRLAPVSGVVLLLMFLLFLITAFTCVRKRNAGGFSVFMKVHQTWPAVYVLLLLHAPQLWLWLLFPFSIILVDRLCVSRQRHVHAVLKTATLLSGKVVRLDFKIPKGFSYQAGQYILIKIKEVSDAEWHPFTISSCPEDDTLSVHIRSPDQYDWCSRMRRLLINDGAQCVERAASRGMRAGEAVRVEARKGDRAPVFSRRFDAWRRMYGSVPCPAQEAIGVTLEGLRVKAVRKGGAAERAGVEAGMQLLSVADAVVVSADKIGELYGRAAEEFTAEFTPEGRNPPDSTSVDYALGLAGTKGAWHVCCEPVGVRYPGAAPIRREQQSKALAESGRYDDRGSWGGVEGGPATPDAADAMVGGQLQDSPGGSPGASPGIQAFIDGPYGSPSDRIWAFDVVILVAQGIGVTPSASVIKQVNVRSAQVRRLETGPLGYSADPEVARSRDLSTLLRRLKREIPKKLYFCWVVSSQAELDWFQELLTESMTGASAERVQCNVFWTTPLEVGRVQGLPWIQPPHKEIHGRPGRFWPGFFKEVKKEHPGEHVGVFFCGGAADMEADLRKQARENSSAGGTDFVVCSERF